jgi:hypothetical protein
MLIKLSDGCYVAADTIAEVKVNDYGNSITVRTKSGIGHCHEPGYGQGVYDALADLVRQINEATSSGENT